MTRPRNKGKTNEQSEQSEQQEVTIKSVEAEDGRKDFIFKDKDFRDLLTELHKQNRLKTYIDELRINFDESEPENDELCGSCKTSVDDEGIQCEICDVWFHYGINCSGIDIKYKELTDSDHIWYLCSTCKKSDQSRLKKNVKMEKKLDVLMTSSATLQDNMDVIQGKIDNVDRDVKNVTNEQKTYAESVKTKKALIIKSKDHNSKIAHEKKTLMSNLGTPAEEVRETKEGHLYVRFKDRSDMEKAKNEFEQNDKISVNVKGKLKPRIKIVNVLADEEDTEVIDSIKMKNQWINNLIEDEEDLKLTKVLQAKDKNYKHLIVRCTPKIRKAIHDRGDKICMLYRRCRVFDFYMPYRCFKCQEFGHSSADCRNNVVCPNCGKDHKSNECMSLTFKCKLCEKKGYASDHKCYEVKKCKVYENEISKTRNNTDHGYD